MVDVVSVGGLTVDFFFKDESLTIKNDRFFLAIGGKYTAETFVENVGGGGGNVAVGLSRLGVSAGVWAELGKGSIADLIHKRLQHEKVNCDLLEERHEFAHVSSILLTQKGERTIITHRSHRADMHFSLGVKDAIKAAKLLFLGNMPDLSLEMRHEIVEHAHVNKKSIALNFGVKDCRLGLKKLHPLISVASFLILNRHELGDLLGVHPNELLLGESNYCKRLGLKDEAVLVVTDGELGSYAQTSDSIYYQKPVKVAHVIDATGAGDSFTAGFLGAVHYGKTVPEALAVGAHNSASVIQVIGAQDGLLYKKDLIT